MTYINYLLQHPYKKVNAIELQLLENQNPTAISSKKQQYEELDRTIQVAGQLLGEAQRGKNEIMRGAFDMKVDDYKKFKGLKRENLRDHMNDLELIFTMLGEASTTEIAKNKDAQGFGENKIAAQKGGSVAGNARKDLEIKSGKKVSTTKNYLSQAEEKKKLK